MGIVARLARRLPGPSLDANPVLWREWYRGRTSRTIRFTWWAYMLAAGFASIWFAVDALREGIPAAPQYPGFLAILLQLVIGLMLLGASASAPMSEERTRRTLDGLLASPMSSRTIVLGKWWGTFRVVPLLVLWPGLIALAMAFAETGPPPAWPPASGFGERPALPVRLAFVALFLGTLLAHGAAITSVGLALAVWMRGRDRASVLGLAYTVMIGIGWIFAVGAVFQWRGWGLAEGLLMLSPIFAAQPLLQPMSYTSPGMGSRLTWAVVWMVVMSAVATGLLAATIAAFDRRFGRIPDFSWLISESPRLAEPTPRLDRPDVGEVVTG